MVSRGGTVSSVTKPRSMGSFFGGVWPVMVRRTRPVRGFVTVIRNWEMSVSSSDPSWRTTFTMYRCDRLPLNARANPPSTIESSGTERQNCVLHGVVPEPESLSPMYTAVTPLECGKRQSTSVPAGHGFVVRHIGGAVVAAHGGFEL